MNKKEKLKEIIKNSEYKFLGIIKILDYPYLKFQCLECNHIFIVDIPTVLENEEIYCSECYKVYPRNNFTSLQKIRKVYDLCGDNISPLEWVEGPMSGKIKFRCNKCGYEWLRSADSEKGCPKCNKQALKTNEWFYSKIKEIHGIKLSVYGEYKGYHNRHKVKCNICGNEYEVTAGNLLGGFGCKKCGYEKWHLASKKSNEIKRISTLNDRKNNVISILNNKFGDNFYIEFENEFTNSKDYVVLTCKKCGEQKKVRVREAVNLTKNVCIKCLENEKEDNIRKICDEIIDNEEYKIISYPTKVKRITGNDLVKIKHKICGNIIEKHFSDFERFGVICKECYPTRSYEEYRLYKYIKSMSKYKVVSGYKIDGVEIDIYIPEIKIGFEYDGLYWHSEEIAGKSKQVDKLEFFKSLNIRVIFIREDEWINKEEIVLSRIKNIIGSINERYYARKCNIIEITKNQSDLFLDKYHIQGKDTSSIRIGLIQDNKLLSVMTFGKTRNSMRSKYDENNDTYELLRFSSRTNISVVGGFSKLFKYFLKMYNPNVVKTFADRRWSIGNVYEKNGFILDHISEPGYTYFKGLETYHRVQFQKHKLERLLENYDPNLSEYQNMLNNKYRRYWDCGQLVYYYVNSEYKGDK